MSDSIKDKYYLKRGINITVDTATIGAIEAFEKSFGYLWGINIKYEEKTHEEKQLAKIWEETRQKILNKASECKQTYSKNLDKFSVKRKNYYEEF